ncbi:hypothetical protein ACOMHN_054006 [Nucella lapillus]
MRHRSIETCLKALTSSILDSVVAPLQERLEDWKKVVAQLDKDHAKEYKKARQEIKKAASDTMRLQKKARKGVPHGKNEMQSRLEVAMQDVNARYQQLEETQKHAVRVALIEERSRFCLFIACIKPFVVSLPPVWDRDGLYTLALIEERSRFCLFIACIKPFVVSLPPVWDRDGLYTLALIEERSRFCLFIACIKPFVDHEVMLLTEVTHLQEIMHSLCMQASEPEALPESSEQVIIDLKGMDPSTLSLQPQVKQPHSPPSSPSSLGSRKSSMCSINSINSSSSGSSKSHSPSHTLHKRTASQEDPCAQEDHTVPRKITVPGKITLCPGRSHCAREDHTVPGKITLCSGRSHCAREDHTVPGKITLSWEDHTVPGKITLCPRRSHCAREDHTVPGKITLCPGRSHCAREDIT